MNASLINPFRTLSDADSDGVAGWALSETPS